MQSGDIPDSAITASSSANAVSYAPSVGRLHFLSAGSGRYGSWAAGANNVQQWFQVDFGSWTKVTAVATQGRQDSNQWVKTYSISYSYDSVFHKTVYNEYGSKKVRNCYGKSMGKVPYWPSFLLKRKTIISFWSVKILLEYRLIKLCSFCLIPWDISIIYYCLAAD